MNNTIRRILSNNYVWWGAGILLCIECIILIYPKISGTPTFNSKDKILRLCTQKDPAEIKQCWTRVVDDLIKKGDIDGAFTTISILYDANPAFGETCHSLTHEIGQAAYRLFATHKDFTVTAKTAYCSYGFYHGFMEALVWSRGDMKQAGEFCMYVDKQLAAVTPDVTLQCYHGIGHGTVNNHDPKTWGHEQSLLDPALELCEKVATSEDQKSRCATGVYNGLSIFYSTGEYNITLDPNDPLKICRAQKKEYQDACFVSMNTLLLQITHNDLAQTVKFIDSIENDTMAQHTMINVSSPFALQTPDAAAQQKIIDMCRSFSQRLHLSCLQGYAFGFLEHGPPEKEYVKSLAFCQSSLLSSSEQNACFDYILSYLPMWYGSKKVQMICATLDSSRKQVCQSYNSAYQKKQ